MPIAQPWRARVWREFHAGNLTRASRDTLLTLATFRGHGGAIHPSHATLTERAGCCVRTVQRALREARLLGLVEWVERRVRASWRWLRTSNAYRLLVPGTAVESLPKRRLATTGQKVLGGESQKTIKAHWEEMRAAAADLPDLLAARRRAMESKFLAATR